MNVTNVYFPVDIELLLNFTICVELSRTFLVAACTCWLGILLLEEFEEFGRNLKNKFDKCWWKMVVGSEKVKFSTVPPICHGRCADDI